MANIVRFGLTVVPSTPADVFREQSRALMEADLKRSDLDEHTLYSTPLDRAPLTVASTGWCVGAYRIQYWSPQGGELEGMWRDRCFYKEGITKAQLDASNNGRGSGKYIGPSAAELDRYNLTTTTPYLYPYAGEVSDVVVICEGEKKAAVVSEKWGHCTIGVGGCYMWGEWEQVGDNRAQPSRVVHEWTRNRIEAMGAQRIVVIADGDIQNNPNVMLAYGNFYAALRLAFPEKQVDVVVPPSPYKGADDWLAAFPHGGMEELVPVPDIENSLGSDQLIQMYRLLTTANGSIHPILDNVAVLLERHPMFKGRLRFNLDTAQEEMDGKGMEDHYVTELTREMQRVFHMPRVSIGTCGAAIMGVCHKKEYSMAMEDLRGWGEWNGSDWLGRIFPWAGEEQRAIIEILAMGYIKRTLWPGCFWRTMVISTGPQGVGKSGLAQWISGSRSRAVEIQPGDLREANKDVMRRLMQAGITLFDDLNQFGHGERGGLKAMVSMTYVMHRKVFGIHDRMLLRRSVMYGTTNEVQIIPTDPTGNTRFVVLHIPERMPIRLGELMHEPGVREGFMAQMMALLMERGGEKYEPDILGFKEQEKFKETSLIEEKLSDFIDHIRGQTPNGGSLIAHKGSIWFKAELFWSFFNGGSIYRPKDWERKEFVGIARAKGLDYKDDNSAFRLSNGVKVKNVFGLKV